MTLVLLKVSSLGTSRALSRERVESLTHSGKTAPVLAVLSKTPGKDTSKTLGGNKTVDLLGDQVSGIPGPVQRSGGIPVPLAASSGISFAVLKCSEERARDIDTLASAISGLAASAAVSSRVATETKLTAASNLTTLERSPSSTRSIGRNGQVLRSPDKVGLFKGNSARLASVASISSLEELSRASGGFSALDAGLGGEPLGIKGESNVELAGLEAAGDVGVDGLGGSLVRGVVGGDAITAVHEIIRHDVDEINSSVDLGDLLMSVGDHVPLKTRNGNGELLVTNGILDLLQELGVALDLVDLLRVWDTLIVLAVASGVLPVDIDTIVSESGQGVCDVPGVPLAGPVRLGSRAEAGSVGPATNSHADLSAIVEESTDLIERLERLILSSGLGSKQRGVGKGGDDMGDTSGLRLVR